MKLQQLYSQVRQAIEDYDMIHANYNGLIN